MATLAAALVDWRIPGPTLNEAEQLSSHEPTVSQTADHNIMTCANAETTPDLGT